MNNTKIVRIQNEQWNIAGFIKISCCYCLILHQPTNIDSWLINTRQCVLKEAYDLNYIQILTMQWFKNFTEGIMLLVHTLRLLIMSYYSIKWSVLYYFLSFNLCLLWENMWQVIVCCKLIVHCDELSQSCKVFF